MFASINTLFVTLAIASYVTAAAAMFMPVDLDNVSGGEGRPIGGSNDCNTGTVHCCDTTQDIKQAFWQHLLSNVGGGAQGLNGLVGLNCIPMTGFASGGSQNCAAQPVCCEEVEFNGLLPVGCNPVNFAV